MNLSLILRGLHRPINSAKGGLHLRVLVSDLEIHVSPSSQSQPSSPQRPAVYTILPPSRILPLQTAEGANPWLKVVPSLILVVLQQLCYVPEVR